MRSLLTAHHVANEVRLKRTQHSGSFLLVEGPDDSRFYKRFVESQQCQVVVAYGKVNVVDAVCLLDSEQHTGVLGVVDSDFDVLDGRPLTSANIVRGECHDVEAMLIRSPALHGVLHELASAEKLTGFETRIGAPLRTWLLENARCLGYLRWNSLRLGLNLRFDGLRFSSFVERKTLQLDPDALANEVRNHSQNRAISIEQISAAAWPANRKHDPWQVCCGHDMVELLTLALRSAVGSRQGLTPEEISRSLRLAYGDQEFAGSELCGAIRQWEANAGFKVLKPIPTYTSVAG